MACKNVTAWSAVVPCVVVWSLANVGDCSVEIVVGIVVGDCTAVYILHAMTTVVLVDYSVDCV